MQLADYQHRYRHIAIKREDGVIELRLHGDGGVAKWGSGPTSLHAELGTAFADLARDAENRVVVLTGTGDVFMAEMDPDDRAPEPSLAEMWPRIMEEGTALLHNHLAIPVPVIAAVNGPALIHAEIAVMADIVLAAPHAEFADAPHAVNGVVPGDGVHIVWPMLLGPNRGRSFLLTGERIGAEEAKRLGVVAEVVAADRLLPRAHEHARRLAGHSPQMLRYTRALLVREWRRRMADELQLGLGLEGLAMIR